MKTILMTSLFAFSFAAVPVLVHTTPTLASTGSSHVFAEGEADQRGAVFAEGEADQRGAVFA